MRELICIVCPRGCHLKVDETDAHNVTGYSCPRGKNYAYKEMTDPTRTLTSVVRIDGALTACFPVKTSGEIPKRDIMPAMALLKNVRLKSPVALGEVIVKDICGTGVDWIATKAL